MTGGPTAPSQLRKTAAQLWAKRPSIINRQGRRARRHPSPSAPGTNPFLPSAPRADPTRSAGAAPFPQPGHHASPVGWGRRPPWESPGRVGKGSGTCWSSGPWRGASPPATGPAQPGALSTREAVGTESGAEQPAPDPTTWPGLRLPSSSLPSLLPLSPLPRPPPPPLKAQHLPSPAPLPQPLLPPSLRPPRPRPSQPLRGIGSDNGRAAGGRHAPPGSGVQHALSSDWPGVKAAHSAGTEGGAWKLALGLGVGWRSGLPGDAKR